MVVEEATRPLSPEVTALLGAIERFRQRPSAHREPAELAAELKAVRHGQDLLDLEFSKIAALFQETQEYEDQGSVSPFDWIRHHCRMSSSAVWSNIAVGQHLDELPGSVSAVENGEIGFSMICLCRRSVGLPARKGGRPLTTS